MIIPMPDRLPDYEVVGYLHRWYLFPRDKARQNTYLHHMIAPDPQVVHNHPWGFKTLILSGGYTEQVMQPDGSLRQEKFFTGSERRVEKGIYHRISHVERNTWTLIVTDVSDDYNWGFWVDGKHVPFDEYDDGTEVIKRA